MRRQALFVALASAAMACTAPQPAQRVPVAPVASWPSLPSNVAPPPSAEPAKPVPPPPRVGAGEALSAAERSLARLQPRLPKGAQLERAQASPVCAGETCVWKWRVVADGDAVFGVLEVDAESGAATFEPNDGRGGRLGIDAFLARSAEREKAVDAVAKLPVVKAYCKKVQALKLGCVIYFEEEPSDEGCTPSSPLASSCWMRVYVGEAHQTHVTRFGSFLLVPGTLRVVGAAGYCDAVPLTRFSGPGSGCPK